MENNTLVDTFKIEKVCDRIHTTTGNCLSINDIIYNLEKQTYKFLKRFVGKSIVLKGNYTYSYKVFPFTQPDSDNIQFTVRYSNWFITKEARLHICKNEFIEALGLNHLKKQDVDMFHRHFSKSFSFDVTK